MLNNLLTKLIQPCNGKAYIAVFVLSDACLFSPKSQQQNHNRKYKHSTSKYNLGGAGSACKLKHLTINTIIIVLHARRGQIRKFATCHIRIHDLVEHSHSPFRDKNPVTGHRDKPHGHLAHRDTLGNHRRSRK